jgi:hypothetical protein
MRDIRSVFSFIQTVQSERVFRVKGGYVVQNFRGSHLVSEDGAVFKVRGKKLSEVKDRRELTAVGRVVGRERPDLAVVVVP